MLSRSRSSWSCARIAAVNQRRITADTALRLARFFGTSEHFWLNLQARYDLEVEKDRLGDTLDHIRPLSAAG
jgi:antitoxin HigA-1